MTIWIVGLTAASTAYGAYSTNQAAKTSAKGAERGIDTQLQMYNQSRADLTPYREVGYQALNAYAQAMGLPGYAGGSTDMSSGHALYGDGNQPLTAEGLSQAYRDVLGREADPGGLQHYLTRGHR